MVTVARFSVIIDNGRLPPEVGKRTTLFDVVRCTASTTRNEIGKLIGVRDAL